MPQNILSNNLFSEVLLNPLGGNITDLYIVSGYASSAMVSHHAEKIQQLNHNINIHLIVGMTCRDGLSKANHLGFKNLMENDLSGRFTCSYLINRPPVHSKVYSWLSNGKPQKGFIGSANYSQNAFLGNSQKETVVECNPDSSFDYYNSLIDDTIYCNHNDVEEQIVLYKERKSVNSTKKDIEEEGTEQSSYIGLEKVTVSLVSSKLNDVAPRGGLNWGQRPEYHRNPNQAYIQLSPAIYKSNFFPLRSIHFTILTDDGKSLLCTRAQKDDKGHAIETPRDNSRLGEYFRYRLGEYFRYRLGVANGKIVTLDDLEKYGRTTIDFYKIDEENYFMDFSV